jgi:hypothetical protein
LTVSEFPVSRDKVRSLLDSTGIVIDVESELLKISVTVRLIKIEVEDSGIFDELRGNIDRVEV